MKCRLRALLGAVCLLSCSPSERKDPTCSGNQPDFVVTIRSELALLPADTKIEVNFGGTQQEVYTLSENVRHQVVFCEGTSGGAGGASGSEPTETPAGAGGAHYEDVAALKCDLWTRGPAEVVVSATGLTTKNKMLVPDSELCTVEEELELERAMEKP